MPGEPQIWIVRSTTRQIASAHRFWRSRSRAAQAGVIKFPTGLPDEGSRGGEVVFVVGDHLLGHAQITQPRAE
jgi:hypothetical protein